MRNYFIRINLFFVFLTCLYFNSFSQPVFRWDVKTLTEDQLKSIGGSVSKDEKGHIVLFWKRSQKKAEEEKDKKQNSIPLLRYYKVFNIAQCRDIPLHLLPQPELGFTDIDPMLGAKEMNY